MELDRNGPHVLKLDECVELLGTAHLGRIALTKNALPTILPVLYEVDGATITFHAAGGLLVAAAERGDIVCFESDFTNGGVTELWSVVVVGKLALTPAPSAVLGRGDNATQVFGPAKVSMSMTIVSGRSAVSLAPS